MKWVCSQIHSQPSDFLHVADVMLKCAAGMLTRGGLPQQLNRSLYPGQVPGQMGGQMGGQVGGRATPPAGLQPPFQGLAERALAGMESYSNAQPKPQAATQQVAA